MSSIFISHSSGDNEVATEIRRRLSAEGHRSVFLDFDPAGGIPAGRSWERELYAQLRACRAVIVVCSESSMASDWVFAEITHARALGKPVFSLRVDECVVRSLLTDVQVIDLTSDREEGFKRLWQGLRLAGLDPESAFDWDGSRPPYPGLSAFEEVDAAIFFGRGRETGEGLSLLQRLRLFGGTHWMLTLGASGSGKSSLVRAGILPRLRCDRERWLVVGPFRPLDSPFEQLAKAIQGAFAAVGQERSATEIAAALAAGSVTTRAERLLNLSAELRTAAASAGAEVLLVVDQIEELLVSDSGRAAAEFLSSLRAALEVPSSHLFVLGTLRSDFLGEFQSHPALRELAFASLAVGPLSAAGFTEIIEGPARHTGIELESGLVQTLVADTETNDALPLLAFTLRELWEGAANRQLLTASDYRERLGGLHGSVARAADSAMGFGVLEEKEEFLLRSAFLAMARIDEEGNYVRQAAAWNELPEKSRAVLERFVAARLLVSRGDGDERYLEVAHESLLRVWERLVGWLAAARALLLWRKRLGESEAEWQRCGCKKGYLLGGPALGEAAGWLDKRPEVLNEKEVKFIRASSRSDRRRRYRLVAFLCAVAVALGAFAFSAHTERQHAERMRSAVTDISQLTAARRARMLAQSLPGASALAGRAGRGLVRMEWPERFIHMVDVDALLARVLSISDDLMIVGLRAETGVEVRWVLDDRYRVALEHPAAVESLEIGAERPGGRWALTAAADGAVRLWELPDLGPLAEALLDEGDVAQVEQLIKQHHSGRQESKARLRAEFAGHDEPVSRLALSPDGNHAVSIAGESVALWRTASASQPVVLHGHQDTVTWAGFSADGRKMVTTGNDGRALVYDLSDLLAPPLRLQGDRSPIACAAFHPDSRQVLTAATDREIREWSPLGDGRLVTTLDCLPLELKYAKTAGFAAVGCADGTARIVDLAGGRTEIFH